MPKLAKSVIHSLYAVDGKPAFAWDNFSGFGVKVAPRGKKTFVAKYRTNGGGSGAQQRWLTLGQFGHITCEQARSLAQQALAAIARGEDPQADRQAKRIVLRLVDAWDIVRRKQPCDMHTSIRIRR